MKRRRWHHDSRWRLAVAIACGVAAAVGLGLARGFAYAPLLGWAATALLYCLITWVSVGPMDAQATATHATAEVPGGWGVHLLLVAAALSSLGGIVMLVLRPPESRLVSAAVSLLVIVASWFTIQTIHALRYAERYYRTGGGVDFHMADEPAYSDFAYMAFTVGMSFAISDTDLASSAMRRLALGHALLAYLFGTVFLAALVNILASLAG